MKLDLVTKAILVDDAVRFVSSNSDSLRSSDDNDDVDKEKSKEPDYDEDRDQLEEEQEDETETGEVVLTTNAVF